MVVGYQAAADRFGQQSVLELQQAAAFLNEGNGRISTADGYSRLSQEVMLLAIDYRNQANSLRDEFIITLRAKSLYDHKQFDAPSD